MSDILRTEQLLEHVEFLKALARRLVDADDADDLVQDTLVSALSSPERPRSLRAWLARIARNRAVSRWRKDHARRDKEQRSTTPTDLPGPSEAAGQLELQERVVEAVRSLDEPYRSVIVQRFYYGSSVRDIAERLGEPVETVRTRLARAMKKLRGRLDAKCGGRRAWLGGLSAFVLGEAAAQTVGVAFSAKFAAAAMLMLATGSVFWAAREAGGDEENADVRSTRVKSQREPAGLPLEAADEEPATARGTMRGVVRTSDHEPIGGARVRLFDTGSSTLRSAMWIYWEAPGPAVASTVTAADGSFHLGAHERGARLLLVEAEGFIAHSDGVQNTDLSWSLTLTAANVGLRTVHVLDEDGNPVADAELLVVNSGTKFMPVARTRTNGSGLGTLPIPRGFSIVVRAAGFAWHEIDHPKEQNEVRLQPGFVLAGAVVDDTGRGIPNATILTWRFFFGREGIRTNASGAFHIAGLDAEEQHLEVTAAGHFQRYLTVWPGDERMRIELLARGAVSGTVFFMDGTPAAGATVTAGDRKVTTDDAGRFEVSDAPSGRVALFAYTKERPRKSLTWVEIPPRGRLDGIELRLVGRDADEDEFEHGFVRIKVVDREGRPLHGVNVWALCSARQKTGKDGIVLLPTTQKVWREEVFHAQSAPKEKKPKTQPDLYKGWVRAEPQDTEAEAKPVALVAHKPARVDIVLRGPNGEAIPNRRSSIRIHGIYPTHGVLLPSGGARFLIHENPGPYSWSMYRLEANASGYQRREIHRWTPPAGGGIVEIRLERGAGVRGRLVDPSGGPLAGYLIRASQGPDAKSGVDGRFVLKNLTAGSIRFMIFRGERVRMVRTVSVGGSGGEVGDWVVPEASRIEGRMVDEKGNPAGGVKVWLRDPWGSNLTRADGKFTLSFPDGDTGLLSFSKPGHAAVPMDVAKLKRGEPLEIILYEGVEVRFQAGWANHQRVLLVGSDVLWELEERGEYGTTILFPVPPLRLRLTLTDMKGRTITRDLDLSGRKDVNLGVIAPPN